MKLKHFFTGLVLAAALNLAGVSLYACTPASPLEAENKTEQKTDPETPAEPENPSEPEEPSDPSEPVSDGILRILAIGNSFSQDAVEQYLYELFDAAGQKVIIGNLYIGGCSLERHWGNTGNGKTDYKYRKVVNGVKTERSETSLLYGVQDEKWDVISLQQSSGVSGQWDSYNPYLGNLICWLRENALKKDFRLAWHQTWAYASSSTHSAFPNYGSDQTTMYEAIVSCVRSALKDNDFDLLIPSGTAIQNARTSYLGDSFNRDGYHLETTYGRYTAACTWFEAISGKSVVGNSYAPSTVDDFQKEVAQNAAHRAVQTPFEVTPMTDFTKPYSGTPEFKCPVQIDFGGGSAASPEGWNRVSVSGSSDDIFLRGSDSEWSPLTLESLSGFTGTFNGVGTEPDKPVSFSSAEYPKSVWADAIVVSGEKGCGDTPAACVTLSGFKSGERYSVRILAVRFNGSADARISEYTLGGAHQYGPKTVQTGMKTYPGEDADFSCYVADFSSVQPDSDGKITVSVVGKDTGKAAEGHISAIVISKE